MPVHEGRSKVPLRLARAHNRKPLAVQLGPSQKGQDSAETSATSSRHEGECLSFAYAACLGSVPSPGKSIATRASFVS